MDTEPGCEGASAAAGVWQPPPGPSGQEGGQLEQPLAERIYVPHLTHHNTSLGNPLSTGHLFSLQEQFLTKNEIGELCFAPIVL